MFEKVNPSHPDKVADRIAGAVVDLAYTKADNPTIAASDGSCFYHYKLHKRISDRELRLIGSFPMDYNFATKKAQWYIGMSVPPVMIAQISYQIYKQWLSKIK